MLRRINDALPGLVLGIIVYGVIVELAGVWFVTDKVRYTTGLLIGIGCCCCDRFLYYDGMESRKSDHCVYRGIGT